MLEWFRAASTVPTSRPRTRVRRRTHEAPPTGLPPPCARGADSQTQGSSHEGVRVLEYGGPLVLTMYRRRRSHTTRILVKIKEYRRQPSDLVKARERRERSPIDLPWIPGHEFFRSRRTDWQ